MADEQVAKLNRRIEGKLPGWFGLEVTLAEPGQLEARLPLRPEFDAPNGFLHAAAVIALADTCCGLGCQMTLPESSPGFTTVELKANFVGTARPGDALGCHARAEHAGRTTQVWDARVHRESDGRPVALFRCTQLVLAGVSG